MWVAYILGLDVAVHHPHIVQVFNRTHHLDETLCGFGFRVVLLVTSPKVHRMSVDSSFISSEGHHSRQCLCDDPVKQLSATHHFDDNVDVTRATEHVVQLHTMRMVHQLHDVDFPFDLGKSLILSSGR